MFVARQMIVNFQEVSPCHKLVQFSPDNLGVIEKFGMLQNVES